VRSVECAAQELCVADGFIGGILGIVPTLECECSGQIVFGRPFIRLYKFRAAGRRRVMSGGTMGIQQLARFPELVHETVIVVIHYGEYHAAQVLRQVGAALGEIGVERLAHNAATVLRRRNERGPPGIFQTAGNFLLIGANIEIAVGAAHRRRFMAERSTGEGRRWRRGHGARHRPQRRRVFEEFARAVAPATTYLFSRRACSPFGRQLEAPMEFFVNIRPIYRRKNSPRPCFFHCFFHRREE
jgi:hypothetical protein